MCNPGVIEPQRKVRAGRTWVSQYHRSYHLHRQCQVIHNSKNRIFKSTKRPWARYKWEFGHFRSLLLNKSSMVVHVTAERGCEHDQEHVRRHFRLRHREHGRVCGREAEPGRERDREDELGRRGAVAWFRSRCVERLPTVSILCRKNDDTTKRYTVSEVSFNLVSRQNLICFILHGSRMAQG